MGCFLACFGFSSRSRKRRKPPKTILIGDKVWVSLILIPLSFSGSLNLNFMSLRFVSPPFCIRKNAHRLLLFFFFLVFLFQSHGSYEPLDSYDVRVDLSVTENENPVRSCSSPPRSALSFSAFFLIFYSSHTC